MPRCARWFCTGLAAVPMVVAAASEVLSVAPDAVEITVYRDNHIPTYLSAHEEVFDTDVGGLAMISEARTLDLPAGDSVIVFQGVADGIVPHTVAIEGLPAQLLEANFDYELLTPGALIKNALGRVVRVVTTDRASGKQVQRSATLLAGPDGVLLDFGDSVEPLNCSGGAERLIFDEVPPRLTAEPTLSMRVRAPAPGTYKVRLSYLSVGMYWIASYLAHIREDAKTLDLVGWLTLINPSATSFANAPTRVVAGRLSRSEDTVPPAYTPALQRAACWPIGSLWRSDAIGAEDMGQFPDVGLAEAIQRAHPVLREELEEIVVTGLRASVVHPNEIADYKLYAVAEPTTVHARQVKQVMLLQQENVPFERVYRYTIDDQIVEADSVDGGHPHTLLRLHNEKSAGLGLPIPAGVVAVTELAENGHTVLAGEYEISDTPLNMPLDVELSPFPGIWVQPRVLSSRVRETDEFLDIRAKVEVTVHNDTAEPVLLEVRHRSMFTAFRLRHASREYTWKHGAPTWSLRLAPGSRQRFVYTFHILQ